MFSCGENKCLSPSLVCDGKGDCYDNSDENIGCSGKEHWCFRILL